APSRCALGRCGNGDFCQQETGPVSPVAPPWQKDRSGKAIPSAWRTELCDAGLAELAPPIRPSSWPGRKCARAARATCSDRRRVQSCLDVVGEGAQRRNIDTAHTRFQRTSFEFANQGVEHPEESG